MNITIDVKKRVENLLIKLPITNSASTIVERFYTNLLKEPFISPLNEARYLYTLTNQLKQSAWIPEVSNFITESEFVINENSDHIKILTICEELKNQKESDFHKRALSVMEGLYTSKLKLNDIEKMKDFTLIPSIKNLYVNLKESVTGKADTNPNFVISNVISPISPITESKYKFLSSGKVLELNLENNTLFENLTKSEPKFEKLVEAVNFFDIKQSFFITGIRNKEVSVNLTEQLVLVNKQPTKVTELVKQLNSSIGLTTAFETKQIQLIEALVSNFDSFVTIDESIKITPIKESGVSYTIFSFGSNLYGQSVNPKMGENSLNIFENSKELLKDIKNKINFDASSIVSELVKSDIQVTEKTNTLQKALQLKIVKLQDKKTAFLKTAISENLVDNKQIQEALKLIDLEIKKLKESFEPLYEKVSVKVNNNKIHEGVCYLSELINSADVNVSIGNVNYLIDRNQIELK